MGRQHGALLRAAGGADELLAYYPEMPERLILPGGRAGELARPVARRVKDVVLGLLENDRPADLRARTEAFLRGLDRPTALSRSFAVMDLFQNVVGTAGRLGIGPFAKAARAVQAAAVPACSSAIVWGRAAKGGALRHARNFDFPGIGVWDAAPALILCAPDRGMRYGFVTTRGVDAAVVTVFNEAGLVITTHTRFHRDVAWRGMAIVDLMHELARRAETIRGALAIARERRVVSTWGLAVSSWREQSAAVVEVNAGRVELVEPPAGADSLICCNRYRHPAMLPGQVAASEAWRLQSDQRERRLRTLVDAAAAKGGADAIALARMLADRRHPDDPDVVRHTGGIVAQSMTVHSVVVEPEARRLSLGVGPAPVCESRWLTIGWSWDGPAGAWDVIEGGTIPGFTIAEMGAGIGRSLAADAVAEAQHIDQTTHDTAAMAAALERAALAAPRDPSIRLALLWTQMRRGDLARALEHARTGLELERVPYPRGQLLLWGARAAEDAGDAAQAAAWRRDLGALRGEGVAELQEAGRADGERRARWWKARAPRRPVANLFMMDAE